MSAAADEAQAAASDEPSPLALELELLRAAFDTQLHISPSPLEIILEANPQLGPGKNRVFASATIHTTTSTDYPATPASFALSNLRGLDDARRAELLALLFTQATEAASFKETHIVTCLLAAEDFITQHNIPNDCPVCMEVVAFGGKGDERMIVLMPCAHALHAGCFKGYRKVLRENRDQKERDLIAREGPAKASRLANQGWSKCPVCRLEFGSELADAELEGR